MRHKSSVNHFPHLILRSLKVTVYRQIFHSEIEQIHLGIIPTLIKFPNTCTQFGSIFVTEFAPSIEVSPLYIHCTVERPCVLHKQPSADGKVFR